MSVKLRTALRLLMLKYCEEGGEELEEEREDLSKVVGRLEEWNCDRMNGVLMGAMQDAEYYGMSV